MIEFVLKLFESQRKVIDTKIEPHYAKLSSVLGFPQQTETQASMAT
jgi:hypothetical protein